MLRKYLPILLVALLFAGMGVYAGWRKTQTRPPETSVVAQLLAQTLPDASGSSQDFSRLKGKTLVVNFWATWCPPCVEEMPELSALQSELDKQNAQIVGIGIDSASNIANFSKRYQIHYPLYVAGMKGSELARQFGDKEGGLPFTVLIDASGKVRKTYLGRVNVAQLREEIAQLRAQ